MEISITYFFEKFKKNFEYAVIGVVIVSLIPMAFEYIRHKKGKLKQLTAKDIQSTFKEENLS